MLQDPMKGVLVPLSPEEASAVSAADVTFCPMPKCVDGKWQGCADTVANSKSLKMPLGGVFGLIGDVPASDKASYDLAYAAMIGGDAATAGAGFAAVALSGGPVAPALYGLALALEKLGAFEEAEALAAFVADLPGFGDPRAAALAGYAAFQRRQPKAARVHLAKAARIARLQPEFRGVQRFAQRVLLMQQFALGD
mgnify:CR=1 FL=1